MAKTISSEISSAMGALLFLISLVIILAAQTAEPRGVLYPDPEGRDEPKLIQDIVESVQKNLLKNVPNVSPVFITWTDRQIRQAISRLIATGTTFRIQISQAIRRLRHYVALIRWELEINVRIYSRYCRKCSKEFIEERTSDFITWIDGGAIFCRQIRQAIRRLIATGTTFCSQISQASRRLRHYVALIRWELEINVGPGGPAVRLIVINVGPGRIAGWELEIKVGPGGLAVRLNVRR